MDSSTHDPWQPPAARSTQPTTSRSWMERVGWLVVLVFGVAAYLLVLRALVATANLNLFPTLLLVGSVTVPLSLSMLAFATSRVTHGRSGLVATTAICAGIIGTTSAGLLEYSAMKALPWTGMLAIGVIEESAKMVVPLVILVATGRRTQGLGVVLGIASGSGFAVLETMGYGLNALIASHGNLATVDSTLLLRALLSPMGHVAWTGLTCMAMWRLNAVPRRRHAVLGLLGAWGVAVALHAIWDGSGDMIVHIVTAGVSLAILVSLIITSARFRPTVPPR